MSGKRYDVTEDQVRQEVRRQLGQITNYADLASQVSRDLGRDAGHKQRILQRSPHLAYSMDAEEVAQASSSELARRELKELGIDCGDNDPLAILDAHHAGRKYARDGNRVLGMEGNKTLGMDSAAPDYLNKYLEE